MNEIAVIERHRVDRFLATTRNKEGPWLRGWLVTRWEMFYVSENAWIVFFRLLGFYSDVYDFVSSAIDSSLVDLGRGIQLGKILTDSWGLIVFIVAMNSRWKRSLLIFLSENIRSRKYKYNKRETFRP